jgi:hypothetical protein
VSVVEIVQPRRPKRLGARKAQNRSRVTNRDGLLPDVDGRTALARRFRDIASAILADQAGADECSEARKQLIRRFAAAAVLAEQMEAQLAKGESIAVAEHALLCSSLVRLSNRIGIDRRARDLGPTLGQILRQGIDHG